MHPEERHKFGPRDGTAPPQGQAERAGAVQPKGEKVPGRLESAFQYLNGNYKKEGDRLLLLIRVCSDRRRRTGF